VLMRFTGFGWNLVDKSDTIRYDTRCCFNVPWTRTSIGQRSYAVYDSRTWNRLPTALRSPELSLALFKRQLKTHRSVPALDSAVCRCGCRVPSSHRRCCDCIQRVRRRVYKCPDSTRQFSHLASLDPWSQSLVHPHHLLYE